MHTWFEATHVPRARRAQMVVMRMATMVSLTEITMMAIVVPVAFGFDGDASGDGDNDVQTNLLISYDL